MAEEWRRKGYYRPRVLIPVDECLDSAFGDCLVCLTGGQLNLVRNLLLYAERRSTFVSEYHEHFYLAPNEAEWDDLQALTAHLEGNLMNCEQFTSDLQEILDWVRLQSVLPGGSFSEDEQAAFPYNDEIEDAVLTPAEEDACAIAQLWYEWGYQTITEQVLPATRWGFDYLVPAITAFIATAIGGPGAGLGVWAIAEFIQELMEIFYRGAETNLVNWMDTNKQDIVCSLFFGLVAGGAASTIWATTYSNEIAPSEDISYGDKLMLWLFMGTWAGVNASLAFAAETEWATSNVEVGYCSSCEVLEHYEWEWELPPCPGLWASVDAEHGYCVESGYLGFESQDGEWHNIAANLSILAGKTWEFVFSCEHKSYLGGSVRAGTLYIAYTPDTWANRSAAQGNVALLSHGPDEWDWTISGVKEVAVPADNLVFLFFKGFSDFQTIEQNTVRQVKLVATVVP